jgi:hypothetical protein
MQVNSVRSVAAPEPTSMPMFECMQVLSCADPALSLLASSHGQIWTTEVTVAFFAACFFASANLSKDTWARTFRSQRTGAVVSRTFTILWIGSLVAFATLVALRLIA